MATKSKKPASRGFVNNIILEALVKGDKYGYEIIKEVEEKSEGTIILKQPSLYSSLKRFEAKGYITSYWGDSDIGGRRHYYTITENGRAYFTSQKNGIVDLDEDDEEELETDNQESASESDLATPTKIVEKINEINTSIEKLQADSEMLANMHMQDIMQDDSEKQKLNPVQQKQESETVTEELEENSEETSDDLPADDLEENVDYDSDDYDVFALLEKDEKPKAKVLKNNSINVKKVHNIDGNIGIQSDMFTKEAKQNPILAEESVDTTALQELKQTLSKVVSQKASEHTENADELKPASNPEKTDKSIPLIKEREQDYFNWEDLKRKIALKSEKEIEKLNNGNSFVVESVDEEIHSLETTEQPNETNTTNDLEQEKIEQTTQEEVKTKKPVKTVVDEDGITRNLEDIQPKKQKPIIDNVVKRIDTKDPLNATKSNTPTTPKNVTSESQPQTPAKKVASAISETSVDFETQEKILKDKLTKVQKEVKNKKTDDINFKDILGDLLIADEDIEEFTTKKPLKPAENKRVALNAELEPELQPVHKVKTTSYAALQHSLQENGISFKPYTVGVSEDAVNKEFVLNNKLKLHFGFIMFVLLALQITAFIVVLNYLQISLTNLDVIITAIAYTISVALLLITTIPYLLNKNKRKRNTYSLSNNLLFGLLTFLGIAVLTFAINSFFDFTFVNIVAYLIPMFMPILLALNFVVAPLVLNILLSNKNYY